MDEKITLKALIENATKQTPKDLLIDSSTNNNVKNLEILGLYLPMTSGHIGPLIHNKIAEETRKKFLQEAFADKDKKFIQNFPKEQALINKIHEEFSHISPK